MTEQRKIKLTLAYEGTNFHGWQVQPGVATVQGTLQEALCKAAGYNLPVTGCSRTDAGVHAVEYVCHTDFMPIPCDKIPLAVNSFLPSGIAVKQAEYADCDFHARYSCLGKEYIYKIHNANLRDPFLANRAMFYPKSLDEKIMTEAAQGICGKKDFCAFMAQGSPVADTVRTVKYCDVTRCGDIITVRVAADGFLYNMVRIIVGTLITASEKKQSAQDIAGIIASLDRTKAGATVPACGLYLNKVFY